MELQLIRTFIEVAKSGSFAAASDRLFVTQSAVSLRVQRLEDQLGRPLFIRSKDGVMLTAAGREFRSFAVTILRNWEQARQRLSASEAVVATLNIGAHASLWPKLGFRWLDALREARPDLQIRSEMGRADALTPQILAGSIQVMLTYTPLHRPGLLCQPLIDDQLVMVSSDPALTLETLDRNYVLVDWGPDFMRAHEEALPGHHSPQLVMALGALTGRWLFNHKAAAYLPARNVKGHIERGTLHLVADAPVFSHPAWVIWREDIDEKLRNVASETLNNVVALAAEETSGLLDLV